MTIVVHDQFNDASTTTQNGTAPDTVNTPGDTWQMYLTSDITCDGAGMATFGASPCEFRIDTGIDDMQVDIDFYLDTADSTASDYFALYLRRDDNTLGSHDTYQVRVSPGAFYIKVIRYIGGSLDATLFQGNGGLSAPGTGDHTVTATITDNGSGNPEITVTLDSVAVDFGSGVTTLEDTDVNKITAVSTQRYSGFRTQNLNSSSGIKDFKVTDLSAGSSATPIHYYRMMNQ